LGVVRLPRPKVIGCQEAERRHSVTFPSRSIVIRAALLALFALFFSQAPAQSQQATSNAPTSGATPRAADGHPDISGIWGQA
jgi:hypothetical protein